MNFQVTQWAQQRRRIFSSLLGETARVSFFICDAKPAARIDIIDSMTVIQQHLHQLCHAFHSQAERLHVSDLGANVDADARDAQISRSGGLRI